ncbi:hypothetical protein SynA1840_01395 [Synechococcus sp. A18-40]|nr:hypothetical protein SynA1840_01395 [Synechococcus sp. A18-40]
MGDGTAVDKNITVSTNHDNSPRQRLTNVLLTFKNLYGIPHRNRVIAV